MRLALVFALLLAACAPLKGVRVWEHRLEEFRPDWFSDGPGKLLVVENHTSCDVKVDVVCENWPEYSDHWIVEIKAHGRASGFAQFPNRDQLVNVCRIADYSPKCD